MKADHPQYSKRAVGEGKEVGTLNPDELFSGSESLFVKDSSILHPFSSIHLTWDLWMVLLLIITIIIVPYELAFQEFTCTASIDIAQLVLLWAIDASFWLDILLNFRTALVVLNPVTGKSEVIIDQRTIAVTYVKFWFWFDAIGSLPIQAIESSYLNTSCSFSAIKALRFNRLARLVRLFRIIKLMRFSRWTFMLTRLQDRLSINPALLRFLELSVAVVMLAHFMACFVYGMLPFETDYEQNWGSVSVITVPWAGEFVLFCPPPSFTVDNEVLPPCVHLQDANCSRTVFVEVNNRTEISRRKCLQRDGKWLEEASSSNKYLISLYYTFVTMSTVGYGDIVSQNIFGIMICTLNMMMGTMLFAIFIGNITELMTNLDLRSKNYRKKMDSMEHFMHSENLPLRLRNRVRYFFEHGYNHARGLPSFIDELPENLKISVVLHLYNDVVRSVPFFAQGSKQFITMIILKLKSKVLAPHDAVFHAGDHGDTMYFLNDGAVCIMLDQQLDIFATMSEGGFFGEECVTGQSDVREVSVFALSWCNLLSLSSQDLEQCIAGEPESRELFRNLVTSSNLQRCIERIQGAIPGREVETETPREEQEKGEKRQFPPVVLRALELQEDSSELKEQRPLSSARMSRNSVDLVKQLQEQMGMEEVMQRISSDYEASRKRRANVRKSIARLEKILTTAGRR